MIPIGKIIEKALMLGAEYADIITYELSQIEEALRGSSIEVNKSKSKVYGVRVIVDGKLGIASSTKPEFEKLVKLSVKLAKSNTESRMMAEGVVAKGKFKFPQLQPFSETAIYDVLEYIRAFADRVKEKLSNIFKCLEVVVTLNKIRRSIFSSEGTDAVEEKSLVDFAASTIVLGNKNISTISFGGSGGLEVLFSHNPESLAKILAKRSIAGALSKRVNPAYRGLSFPVILDGKAAAALFHEAIGHTLEADVALEQGKPLKYGVKIACKDLTVLDDPLIPDGYGSFSFDDEGILARRKILIENGVIVNLLHNRWSAYVYNVEPLGNGRGLFFPPKAFMSNIKVKAGDWHFKEIINETRRGFLVRDVVKAELTDIITIIPEESWLIERGEIKEPVYIREIKFPLKRALMKIDAIGREMESRFTVEKGLPIGEYSPPIRIAEAYVF